MKKAVCALVFTILCALSLSGEADPDIYVTSSPIVKILSHELGYKVFYIKQNSTLGSFYVPKTWFRDGSGRGFLIWGNKLGFPFFTIFFEDNEFAYIKLYLKDNLQHTTWGVLDAPSSAVKEQFEIETLSIEY